MAAAKNVSKAFLIFHCGFGAILDSRLRTLEHWYKHVQKMTRLDFLGFFSEAALFTDDGDGGKEHIESASFSSKVQAALLSFGLRIISTSATSSLWFGCVSNIT